jgi:hypothetical protein
MNSKSGYWILLSGIILILVLTVGNFPNYLHFAEPKLVMKDRFLWDNKAMDMMRKVTTVVPPGVTIAVSDYKPDFEYATNLRTVQPYDISSAEKVHDYVSNYTKYLVAIEHDWDQNIIWGTDNIDQKLSKYYKEIGKFSSEFFTIHVLEDKTIAGLRNVS